MAMCRQYQVVRSNFDKGPNDNVHSVLYHGIDDIGVILGCVAHQHFGGELTMQCRRCGLGGVAMDEREEQGDRGLHCFFY